MNTDAVRSALLLVSGHCSNAGKERFNREGAREALRELSRALGLEDPPPAADGSSASRYELEMDSAGHRFWMATTGGELQPLPAGYELRFYSEPPADGKVDGHDPGVDLKLPIGAVVLLTVPPPAESRKREARATLEVLRRQVRAVMSRAGQPPPSDAAVDSVLLRTIRTLESKRGAPGALRISPSTAPADEVVAVDSALSEAIAAELSPRS